MNYKVYSFKDKSNRFLDTEYRKFNIDPLFYSNISQRLLTITLYRERNNHWILDFPLNHDKIATSIEYLLKTKLIPFLKVDILEKRF